MTARAFLIYLFKHTLSSLLDVQTARKIEKKTIKLWKQSHIDISAKKHHYEYMFAKINPAVKTWKRNTVAELLKKIKDLLFSLKRSVCKPTRIKCILCATSHSRSFLWQLWRPLNSCGNSYLWFVFPQPCSMLSELNLF